MSKGTEWFMKNNSKNKRFTNKKELGQHFLSDTQLLESLVQHAGISQDDSVIEIGTGLGTLTYILEKYAKEVVTIELDDALIPILKVSFALHDRIKLIHGNILEIDLNSILATLKGYPKIVANIPYYITTDILKKLLGQTELTSIALLVQKEVALKVLAEPGDSNYCLTSLLSHYYTNPVYCMDVPKECFNPIPQVDSAFIRMDVKKNPYFSNDTPMENHFFSICESLFFMRRKTILNNLIARYALSREKAARILEEAQINPSRRGETLQLPEIYRLTITLFGK